ncbi:MAG: methyltransferase domain-containing protein [Pseudomonadota bacterium]
MSQSINRDTFYTDHWRDIEDARIERYEEMFVWHERQAVLLEGAHLELGNRVLDLGSGPGFFAGGVLGLVGASGQVDGADINARFVTDANQRHQGNDHIRFHHVTDHRLPFDDDTFDRAICKNVLEYVPNLDATLAEVRRVLKPGGRIFVIDSDWGFVIVHPWSKETVDRFFEAASPAFNEPYIGRRIPGLLFQHGFAKVQVKLSPFVDQTGRGLHVLRNMASYIATFDSLPGDEVERLIQQVADTHERGDFLFCLPQFLVGGVKT